MKKSDLINNIGLKLQKISDILLADIGNSRTKFLLSSKVFPINNNQIEISDFLLRNKFSQLIYTSVNNEIENQIIDILNLKNINYLNSSELIDQNHLIDFSKVSGMGQDRKLGLLGTASIYGLPAISIDCGTAVTVNAADKRGHCLGGAIFPDIELQFRALHEFTSSLPQVKNENYFHIGNNTKSAINFGVLASVAGGIIKILDTIIKENFNGVEPSIAITGGLSEIIFPLIENDFPKIRKESDLVLQGLAYIINPDQG